MTLQSTSISMCVLAIAFQSIYANDREWGGMKGVVVTDSNQSAGSHHQDHSANGVDFNSNRRGLPDVYVFLRKKPLKTHDSLIAVPDTVRFERTSVKSFPQTLVVRCGQSVTCTNGGKDWHNLCFSALDNPGQNILLAPEAAESKVVVFQNPERLPVQVSSQTHLDKVAYWLVCDHPYAVVSDDKGMFHIDNLPVGVHEFQVWHQQNGFILKSMKVSITASQVTDIPQIYVPRIKAPLGSGGTTQEADPTRNGSGGTPVEARQPEDE